MLIPLCKNISERYYFNILIIITIICHIYIESELYQLAYRRGQNWIFQVIFLIKQWISVSITFLSPDMVYSDLHVDM